MATPRRTLCGVVAIVVVAWVSGSCLGGVREIVACRSIANDAERLACFDRYSNDLPPDAAAAAPLATRTFGLPPGAPHTAQEFGNPPIQRAEVTNIEGNLDRVDVADGKPTFYLDNGQVWAAQQRKRVTMRGDGSDHVIVQRSLFGYLLTVNDSRAQISVVRVR